MKWFLRLFAAYRQMESALVAAAGLESDLEAARDELDRLSVENARLQVQLEASKSDREKLWQMTQEALSQERGAYQMHINVQWQQKGHGAPYPEAPHIPPPAVPQQGDPQQSVFGRMELPSETERRLTRDFIKREAEKLTTQFAEVAK